MAEVKAVFKNVSLNVQNTFKNSCCLLTISVGQDYHESELFEATLKLVNNSFEQCVILVDDSLQRHTMALSRAQSADFFYDISIKEGDLWLDRNERYLKKLSNLKRLLRWNFWLNHPCFLERRNQIKNEIENDKQYKYTFDKSISDFLSKYIRRIPDLSLFDMDRARQLSFDFILEECTALSLWPELDCHYELYPNKHNEAIEETRRRYVINNYASNLDPVIIAFRNAKQTRPQTFMMLQEGLC